MYDYKIIKFIQEARVKDRMTDKDIKALFAEVSKNLVNYSTDLLSYSHSIQTIILKQTQANNILFVINLILKGNVGIKDVAIRTIVFRDIVAFANYVVQT